MFYQRYEFVSLAILLFIWLEWLSRLGTVANPHWIFLHILCFYNHQYSFGKKSYQLPEKKTIKSAKNPHRLRATWPRGDRSVFTVPFQNYLYIGVSYRYTRLAIRKHKTGEICFADPCFTLFEQKSLLLDEEIGNRYSIEIKKQIRNFVRNNTF